MQYKTRNIEKHYLTVLARIHKIILSTAYSIKNLSSFTLYLKQQPQFERGLKTQRFGQLLSLY